MSVHTRSLAICRRNSESSCLLWRIFKSESNNRLIAHSGSRCESFGDLLISCQGHAARQLQNSDYEKYDLLIGMDRANLRNMYRICGGDFSGKMHLLMEYAGRPKMGPPREPSEAGRVGRGGARERLEFSPQAETEKSGLCSDEVADP